MPSAPPQPTGILHAHARTRRRKKRMTKPKMWDVTIKGTSWDWDIERMKPVAVELLAPPRPTASHAADTRRANWLFSTFAHSHKPQEAQPSMPQARVTVLLSMPAQDRAADVHSREYVIGTTHLPFNLEEPPLRIMPLPFQVGEDSGAAKVERFLQY
ncbi:hypothetical protein NM688_g5643 [Phlebia brevispora]|uniref:Uncharacterized protein n=1 Tax=Phlebia brevispora TaxID=194682 RepID=A0ACC1SRZ4_9APHY|nr:hypothetical protein NM688_g5643 [Phlebia brevispora]